MGIEIWFLQRRPRYHQYSGTQREHPSEEKVSYSTLRPTDTFFFSSSLGHQECLEYLDNVLEKATLSLVSFMEKALCNDQYGKFVFYELHVSYNIDLLDLRMLVLRKSHSSQLPCPHMDSMDSRLKSFIVYLSPGEETRVSNVTCDTIAPKHHIAVQWANFKQAPLGHLSAPLRRILEDVQTNIFEQLDELVASIPKHARTLS